MNGAMLYLLSRRFKNALISVVQKPSVLIYTLFMAALLFFSTFAGNRSPTPLDELRNIEELCSIVTAFYTLMFLLVLNNGFGDGASMFKLADVNLLFPSPVAPSQVLNYGLFQQLSSSLLMSFFIFFQYSWMRSVYGVQLPELLLMLVGYSLTVFAAQFSAMVLYTVISGNEKRRKIARAAFVAVPAMYAAWLFFSALSDKQNVLSILASAGVSLPVRLFPGSGWIGGFVTGILTGEPLNAVLGLSLTAALIVILTIFVKRTNPDYYEDVLSPAETAQSTRDTAKAGRLRDIAPKKLRLGDTGIERGSGAEVLYYKHKIENRRSRVFILDGTTLLFAALTVGISFFMQGVGLLAIAIYATYMQFFTVAIGRFIKELTKPFIYLIPEPPFKKLLWAMLESIPGYFFEAALIFIPVCLILGLGPAEMAACILMRVTYSILFLCGNLVVERIFGTVTVKALIMFFYVLVVLILAAPGGILAIVLNVMGTTFISTEVTACLTLAVCNVPIALLCMFLCRNILDNTELNN